MTTVVLGGTGYLGSAVCRLLRGIGPVTSVSRFAPPVPRDDHVVADLSDAAQVRAAVEGADTVVCLMGYRTAATQWRLTGSGAEARRVNVDAVREVLHTLGSRPVPTNGRRPLVVLAGTMAVHVDHAEQGYAAQKRAAEQMLVDAVQSGLVRGTSLQLATVYGVTHGTAALTTAPLGGTGVVASWARAAVRGEPLRLWGEGAVRRDLVHVGDVAHAFELVVQQPGALRPTYQVGTGIGRPLRWIAEQVALAATRHTGRSCNVETLPAPPHAAPSDLCDVVADPAPFTADTGWTARTDPTSAIADLVAHGAHEPRN